MNTLRNGKRLTNDLALLPPRLSLAATMLHHGSSKLRREKRPEVATQFEGMGIRPGRIWGLATGIAETCAGVFALAGIFTRPAALIVLVTQAVAIQKVHSGKGFSNVKGGYEFNLALSAMAASLLVAGPGRLSVYGLIENAVGGWRAGGVSELARMGSRRRKSFALRLLELLA
jgi:putative oxidoreductase